MGEAAVPYALWEAIALSVKSFGGDVEART